MVQSLFCLDFGQGSFYFWPNLYFLCLGLLRGSSKFRVQSFTKPLKFGKFKFWSCQHQSSEFLGSKLVLTNRVRLNTSQNSIVIFIFPIFVVYNRILKFFEVISFDTTGGIIQLYMNFGRRPSKKISSWGSVPTKKYIVNFSYLSFDIIIFC